MQPYIYIYPFLPSKLLFLKIVGQLDGLFGLCQLLWYVWLTGVSAKVGWLIFDTSVVGSVVNLGSLNCDGSFMFHMISYPPVSCSSSHNGLWFQKSSKKGYTSTLKNIWIFCFIHQRAVIRANHMTTAWVRGWRKRFWFLVVERCQIWWWLLQSATAVDFESIFIFCGFVTLLSLHVNTDIPWKETVFIPFWKGVMPYSSVLF